MSIRNKWTKWKHISIELFEIWQIIFQSKAYMILRRLWDDDDSDVKCQLVCIFWSRIDGNCWNPPIPILWLLVGRTLVPGQIFMQTVILYVRMILETVYCIELSLQPGLYFPFIIQLHCINPSMYFSVGNSCNVLWNVALYSSGIVLHKSVMNTHNSFNKISENSVHIILQCKIIGTTYKVNVYLPRKKYT